MNRQKRSGTRTQFKIAGSPPKGFTQEERAAMRERARELKAEARAAKDRAAGEKDVLAAIAKMPDPDRSMASKLHTLIKASAPELAPKTWYGMPAYANDDKIICYFRLASKFKDRYATFGFNDKAKLDDGNMWPTSFALTKLAAAEEKRIAALLRKAVSLTGFRLEPVLAKAGTGMTTRTLFETSRSVLLSLAGLRQA